MVGLHTGKKYLFGGTTRKEFFSARNDAITRSFGDIWQLRVDLPGGYFEEVNQDKSFLGSDVTPVAQLGHGRCGGQFAALINNVVFNETLSRILWRQSLLLRWRRLLESRQDGSQEATRMPEKSYLILSVSGV
jgi:hypothetical protein